MMGKQPEIITDDRCEYPNLGGEGAMRDVGLEEVEVYIARRKNIVAHYITTWPILYLCIEAIVKLNR